MCIAMFHPPHVGGDGLIIAALCQHTGKAFFDAFSYQSMRVEKPVAYKINPPGCYRKYLPIALNL